LILLSFSHLIGADHFSKAYIHVCKASKEKQSSVAALHINILGRMHWDSETVRVKHMKYVFGSRKGGSHC